MQHPSLSGPETPPSLHVTHPHNPQTLQSAPRAHFWWERQPSALWLASTHTNRAWTCGATNLSFTATFQKTKGRLSAPSLVRSLQDQEKAKSSATRGGIRRGEGVGSHRGSEKASEALDRGLTESIAVPQAVTKDWKRCLLHHMQRQQCKTSRNMKNQGKVTPPKGHNNFPVSDPPNREIYNIPDKEFKIAFLRNPYKLSESTERQFNEIRKTIH